MDAKENSLNFTATNNDDFNKLIELGIFDYLKFTTHAIASDHTLYIKDRNTFLGGITAHEFKNTMWLNSIYVDFKKQN